uniref:Putative structural protein n=1 Tax=viral metagenome TaxID=1070528 RepID=A0A6M3IEB9_9ZZZZ
MATYQFYKRGASIPHHNPGDAPFKANIDIPDIIANGGLANTSDVATALASTGFAANDVLRVFEPPAGFLLRTVGVRVTTVEGGAATLDIGNASATQTHLLAAAAVGYMGTCDLNTAGTQITLVADTHLGGDTYEGVVFVTDGTIDITFNTAATAAAIFDVFACGWQCW